MEKKIKQVVEYVLDNGSITKDVVINAFDFSDEEYNQAKNIILKHDLIEPGPKGTGGFLVKKRAGKAPENSDEGPVFYSDWENKTISRLCELLQHRELEGLLGPIVQTVRQARAHATGQNRRGSKHELAAALLIQYGVDLFSQKDIRELIGKSAKVDVPRRWHPGKGQTTSFVSNVGFPSELCGIPSEDDLPDYEYLEGKFKQKELADYQIEVQQELSESLRTPGRRAIVTLPTGAGKTLVAVDTIREWFTQRYDSTSHTNTRSILWLAHTEELCEQAYTCFRQVWEGSSHVSPLMLFRFWGRYTKSYEDHKESLNRISVEPSVLT